MTAQDLILPGKNRIPTIGLGTWQSERGEVGQAVLTALKAGYRHLDCAWVYRNEAEIGAAIKDSGIARSELFLTSKLWNGFHAPEHVEKSLDETLKALQTEYLDLYLMHWPIAFGVPSDGKPRGFPKGPDGKVIVDWELSKDVLPTWRAMESLVDKGKVKNIGISNFSIGRCRKLLETTRIPPAVNQVEINWPFPQHELVDWCKLNGIVVEAYSPLGSNLSSKYLAESSLAEIARKLGGEPAQVIIGWLVKRGLVVLVKSVTASRIKSNLSPLDIPDDVFQELQRRSRSAVGRRSLDPSKAWGVKPSLFEDIPEAKL
ncbi:Aldo/keto reductase [Rickenella mellea]|uniref:Aldo/keto reductase n=1 Tax=Rickenella mellea TaxID=50990 RepID=A0A4Y7PZB6_9AGAM|nr:Aldo/keto reductase [Rickenella mellea]